MARNEPKQETVPAGATEEQEVRSASAAKVVTMTEAELEALLDEARTEGREEAAINPAPAIESGPHLDDPEVREAKRKQLRDYYGPDADWIAENEDQETDRLTPEMRAILREKGR